jgi:hypothetical protein
LLQQSPQLLHHLLAINYVGFDMFPQDDDPSNWWRSGR